jgi:hypothetical protein
MCIHFILTLVPFSEPFLPFVVIIDACGIWCLGDGFCRYDGGLLLRLLGISIDVVRVLQSTYRSYYLLVAYIKLSGLKLAVFLQSA